MIRPQIDVILEDLKRKMVFIVGPRQSGKTTLAIEISKQYQRPIYLNFDNVNHREIIFKQSWLPVNDLVILDEIHKMSDWKNFLKGVFDTKPKEQQILVTGSARLEMYDRIGDSLAGRYYRHRLLPLSLAELKKSNMAVDLNKLLDRGGFPEPYFSETDLLASRWREDYLRVMLSTDVFEIQNIRSINKFSTLFTLLRSRVGSPISYQSLSNDIGISPMTVKNYIEILVSAYVVFIVTPYNKNIARSILKEPKVYFFDTAAVLNGNGPILENLVAVSLLKDIYACNDQLAHDKSLHYLRNKENIEVDFVVAQKNQIVQMIEVKISDNQISKGLRYFKEKYNFEGVQLVQYPKTEYQDNGIQVVDAKLYLENLFL